MARSRLGVWALVGLVFLIAAAVSVHQRLPYAMIDLAKGQVHWLTASTVKYVDNWERDGYFADRGLLLERPTSIETPDLVSREVYASFLPGFAVEILLAHKLAPGLALLNTVLLFGILNQLLVCVVCGLIIRHVMAKDEPPLVAGYFVLAAMLFYLLHPGPSFLHATTYQAFQAEILPFSLIVLLETKLRLGRGDPRRLSRLLALTIGWLSFVDWMWVPVCVVLSLLRLLASPGEGGFVRRCWTLFLQVWLLPIVILAAYLALLWQVGALGEMISRAVLRTGAAAGAGASLAKFLASDLVSTLGPGGYYLSAAALVSIALLVRDRRDVAASMALLVLLPCFLYVVLLMNDSATHEFSILKFYFAMVVAVGALVPYRLMQLAVARSGPRRVAVRGVALVLIAYFSTLYLVDFRDWPLWGDGWRRAFDLHFRQNPPPDNLPLALWLRDNARYDEVYVSRDVPVTENPPTAIAIARKRVWRVLPPRTFGQFLRDMPPGARPRFVADARTRDCLAGPPLASLPGDVTIFDAARFTSSELECLDRSAHKD